MKLTRKEIFDIRHLTERGCQFIASKIAEYLRQHDGPASLAPAP